MSRTRHWPLLLGTLATAGLVVASLFVGAYDFGAEGANADMFFITRVPRAIGLVLTGATLAMCGLVMQLLTQNRFVEPSTAGTTEWAGLGVLLMLILAPGAPLIVTMLAATAAAFIGTCVFFAMLQRISLRSSLMVPIVGIMLGAVVGAVSTLIALGTDLLQVIGIWFAGSFTSVLRGQYEVLWLVPIVTVGIFVVADRFTLAGLGKDIATNAGVNYHAVLLIGTSMVALAVGVTTVVVGAIPFLGLIVPNVVSMIRGDNMRANLPWVALGGVATLTVCDIIGRTIRAPFEVPVSLILGVVGAIVFVLILVRQRRVI